LRFPIKTPSGGVIKPPTNGWRWSHESILQKISSGEIVFSDDETRIIRKIYLGDQGGRTPENVWDGGEVGSTRDANREIQEVFGSTVFETPKPTGLVRRILDLATTSDSEDIILDFFAGSGSTAHAVALQNAEDGGRRRMISVNIPEPTPTDSAAAKAGFDTVSDITLARINWVIENVPQADAQGLRALTLSSSQFRDSAPGNEFELFELSESTLLNSGPDLEAVTAEVLLKEGVPLDAVWERHEVGDAPMIVADGVAAVRSLDITDAVVTHALDLKPRVIVFLEDGFAGKDDVKANAFTQARNIGVTMKTV